MDYLKMFLVVAVIASLGVGVYYTHKNYEENKYIEYKGVKISQEDYSRAKEVYADRIGFDVCNIKTGACIRFQNIEAMKQVMESGS